MTILLKEQVVDFLRLRISKKESEQILRWCNKELQTKIATIDSAEKRHLLQIVAYQTLNSLRFVLQKKGSSEEQPLLIKYYRNLISTTEQQPIDAKLKEKIIEREKFRNNRLNQLLNEKETLNEFRFIQIADWFEKSHTFALEFDVVVDAFVEYMAQKMLEISLTKFIFPTVE